MKKLKFTNTIRRHRFNNNEMTQEELAEVIGVTRQTIIALEAERYTPSLELAMRMARFFHVTVEDLFRIENERQLGGNMYT